MKIEVKVPSVGESIVSGILARWVRADNETVKEGDIIFELETDKVNVEVPSPASGKLILTAAEGSEVKIGQTVAYIDTELMAAGTGEAREAEKPAAVVEEVAGPPPDIPRSSPSVRKIAGDSGIDIAGIKGTGKDGRVTGDDVLNKMREVERERQTAVKMSPMRRAIAGNLLKARHEAAHLTTFNEINMEHIQDIRARYRDEFLKRYSVKLGIMSFFVKASCRALKDFPEVNTMVSGESIVYNHYYNIGVAVAVEEGLIVPVIRDADKLSFAEIELAINELAVKARDRKITLDELQGGTFSITNGGIFGSMMSTPIPNYPETAILGMHAIKDRPYVTGGKIEIKPIMYVALTYDHRVIDGKDAVLFLISIKKYIEDPESLLIEL